MTFARKRARRPILKLDGNPTIVVPTEFAECKAFWDWAQYHALAREYLIKNVNEGKYEDWWVKALIGIGMRPGLPDYHYAQPNGKYLSLWIEMKRVNGRGKKTRKEQDEWLEKLNRAGSYACYAYGCEDAIKIFNSYINNTL